MKSRKQIEAQLRAKKEKEERQKKLDEELRLQSALRKKEQKEQEQLEAQKQLQRKNHELETRDLCMKKAARILSFCKTKLEQAYCDQRELKQFLWSMRCDGLPDPANLAQLNTYCYQWSEMNRYREPSMERLLSRAPELEKVISDLDELLENTGYFSSKRIRPLFEMRQELSKLRVQEIESAIQSVLYDVEKHLIPDETQLSIQVSSELFSLGLVGDTAKNTSLTRCEFTQMGITVDLPLEVSASTNRPIIASFIWFRERSHWEPPLLNGCGTLSSLLQPISKQDCLYDYIDQAWKLPSNGTTDMSSEENATDLVDMELMLLVSGVFQLELLQFPVQPHRFTQWTVAQCTTDWSLLLC